MKGGIYRGSRKQKGGQKSQKAGFYKGSRKQKGGFFPFVIPPLVLAGLKAAGAAAALGAAGAAGHHATDAIVTKIKGGGKRKRKTKKTKWI